MTSLTSARIDELEDTLKRCFPTTDWKRNLETSDTRTICVPQCVDVLRLNSYRGSADEAREGDRQNITGSQAEAEFLNRFTELKLGGILIACLRTSDLEKTGRKQKGHNVLADGDWDAIFIHSKRGIFVVEVKGTGPEVFGEHQMAKAKAQLDKLTENIRRLYKKFFNRDFPSVTGIICFPNRQWIMTSEDKVYQGYDVIDSTIIHSAEKLRRLFQPRAKLTVVEEVFIARFAAELICCRSEVMFHSQAYNAMQVAQWIQTQDYQSKNQKKQGANGGKMQTSNGMAGDTNFGRIILTAQQLEIVNCPDRCITIRGTPGSGKTLIVMIRALAAAKTLKTGRVLVFVNEALMPKYERYFFEAKSDNWIARDPIVLSTDRMKEAQNEDDVFFDETPIQAPEIRELKKRALASGKTTVVFTGFDKPGRADTEFRLYENELSGFNRHFTMNVVLRGTKEIFNEWQKYFHRGTNIGHTITGVAVDRIMESGIDAVQKELLNKVLILLKDPPSSNREAISWTRLTSVHLAVITSHTDDAERLRRFFAINKIATGSIKEQVNDSKPIMAVDTYDRTPSYEWPVVFIVHRIGDPKITKESVFSMAASRCIASLTIVEYDSISIAAPTVDRFSDLKVNESLIGRAQAAGVARKDHKNAQGTAHVENFGKAQKAQGAQPFPSAPQKKLPQNPGPKSRKPKTWIRLEIGDTENSELFFTNFVSAANAAGHNLQDCTLHLLCSNGEEAATYLRHLDGINATDYIIALDYSGFTGKVESRACNVLMSAFPIRPQPYTVFKSIAKKCLPGCQDYEVNMQNLVQKVFRHFETRSSN